MKDYCVLAKEVAASYHEKLHPGDGQELEVLSASMGAGGWQAVVMTTRKPYAVYTVVHDEDLELTCISGYEHTSYTEGELREPGDGPAYVADSREG